MNKLITLFLSTLIIAICSGQNKYEPQILILSPNEVHYDKSFEKEIDNNNKEIKKAQKQLKGSSLWSGAENQSENIKIMMKNEIEFAKGLDFFKQITLSSEQYLGYRFLEKFPNLLITLKDIKCKGVVSELKKVSDENKLQYVLNFPMIDFYKQSGISYAKVKVQLYNQTSNSILLDKFYIGDWNNPGFEFACNDSTLDCTINNALAQALGDVIGIIAKNSPTLKKENDLSEQRFSILMNDYYSKPYDKSFLRGIISAIDSTINLNTVYQCLIDESRTKFVAFFLQKSLPNDFKSLKDNNKDRNVTIISGKDIKDSGYLDNIPQTYAFIVKGVNYKNKWYYQKDEVTYFEAANLEEGRQQYFNNLQKWNFFKENTTVVNSSFWETNLFDKIKDMTKDPDWNKYGKTIWETEENENREYIGMYEIVANELKKIRQKENEDFDLKISNDLLIPAYERQVKDKSNDFSEYSMLSKKITLIYPKERNLVLNPIIIKNAKGEKSLRFFVVFPDSRIIYEWTYFKPKALPEKTWHYTIDLIDQLKTITEWNFAFSTLDDKNFWDKYVLAKSGESYKYLKELK